MSKANEIYFVELQPLEGGEWLRVNLNPATSKWCEGWISCYVNQPGPRLAARVRRQWSDRIVDRASAKAEVDIGQVARQPTAAQYWAAGERALAHADALDAIEARSRPRRGGE